MLQDRNTQFIVNNEDTITRMLKKNLPQGTVPILYDVYTSEIHLDLPDEVRIIQFDDVAIYACGIDRQRNKNLIKEAVNILIDHI